MFYLFCKSLIAAIIHKTIAIKLVVNKPTIAAAMSKLAARFFLPSITIAPTKPNSVEKPKMTNDAIRETKTFQMTYLDYYLKTASLIHYIVVDLMHY